MKPVYMKLAGTFRSPIRRSLACSLHEIAKILGPELADRDLSMAFSDCLMAEDEVKEGVIGHVVEFISCLSPKFRSAALRDLFGAWSDLERSSNWRLRDSLAGQLPALCEIAEGKDLIRYLIPLTVKACTDGVSTIRESGVMSFPTLWEASDRLGSFSERVKEVSPLDLDILDDGPVMGSFGEGEDVEMEDVTNQLHSDDLNEFDIEKPLISFDQDDDEDETQTEWETVKKRSNMDTDMTTDSPMTTVKEQVIRHTNNFTVGGFRARVVAVQIIQSLLDSAISVEEFEAHFLDLLVERLATDTVVNVRIWVSRVVTWIFESSYYGDGPVSQRLQDVLAALQQDPDRDVRIYAGGSAELPKPVKRKKSKKKKGKNGEKKKASGSASTSQLANGLSSQERRVSSIDEGDEDKTPVSFLAGEAGEEDEDEDGEDDDDDSESGDESEEDPENKEKGNMDYLESAKSKVTNKPRNRNSIGIGMKVMVGNKLTVSGKEIRKPKTSWDYVHGELDEDDEVDENGKQNSFSASLGSGSENGKVDRESSEDNKLEEDAEAGGSLFDAPRQARRDSSDEDDEDDEDSEQDMMERGASKPLSNRSPYGSKADSDSVSRLNNQVDDVVDFEQQLRNHQSIPEETEEDLAVIVSGGKDDQNLGSVATSASYTADPSVDSNNTLAGQVSGSDSSHSAQGSTAADLLSPVKDTVTVNAATTPPLSATNTKSNADSPHPWTKSNGNGAEAAATATKGRSPEEEVLRVLNAKLLAGTGAGSGGDGKVAGVGGGRLGLVGRKLPPISVSSPPRRKLSLSDAPGSPSYAAVVASGATSPRPIPGYPGFPLALPALPGRALALGGPLASSSSSSPPGSSSLAQGPPLGSGPFSPPLSPRTTSTATFGNTHGS